MAEMRIPIPESGPGRYQDNVHYDGPRGHHEVMAKEIQAKDYMSILECQRYMDCSFTTIKNGNRRA